MIRLRNGEVIEILGKDGDLAIVEKTKNTYDVNFFERDSDYAYLTEIDIDSKRLNELLREYGFIQ